MQVIEITGATGSGPYNVYLCDYTFTYCVLISGSTTIPTVEFELPPVFDGAESVIVKIVDTNSGCETFQLLTCPATPTPTPSITPTITPTTTPGCHCISFENTGVTIQNFSLIQCNGSSLYGTINIDTTLYYCGSNPSGDIDVSINIGNVCVENSCVPEPTPTPTNTVTPTVTPTISVTPSVTPTISVTPSVTPTISVTPSVTPTISVTPSVTPTVTPTKTQTPTPTVTPTPTSSPSALGFAYLFIEPVSASTNIGTYMYNNGSPQFFGFTNTTQPSSNSTDFNFEMNLYVNYSGWTTGLLPSIITSNVPQVSGGFDSFGNPKIQYNFETTEIVMNTVQLNAWYTWIIPIDSTNNESQTEINLSLASSTIFSNVLTEPTIRAFTFTYTGSTIPPVTYRVYTTYPSTDFYINNSFNNIYFKGSTVSP